MDLKFKAILLCIVLLGICSVAYAQPTDVPADHWAYAAVNKLANEGLVLGYPDGRFLGDRILTRYEMASIVARILDRIDQVQSAVGTPKPQTEPTNSSTQATSVTKDDVETVSKLVDEFKVELTVMGTRLDKVEASIASLESKVEMVNTAVTDEKGPVMSTKADVAKLKKITVSGFIQSRYEVFPDKVDEDGKHAVDGFNIRRDRVTVTAKPTDKAVGVVQIAGDTNKVTLKDAYIQYNFATSPGLGLSATIGQMNWPFGYEVPYSDALRETPERALWSRRLFPGERDRGFKLTYPIAKNWMATAGVFDGTGIDTYTTYKVTDVAGKTQKATSQVTGDFDNGKDVVLNVQHTGGNLEFGASAYLGKGVWNADKSTTIPDLDKIRYGVDARYFLNNITLKAEYVRAKGVDTAPTYTKWLDGYYAQGDYNLSKRDTFVARYESMSVDPLYVKYGQRSAWNLGMIHWLDDRTKVKLFYQINNEEKSSIDNNIWRLEWLLIY